MQDVKQKACGWLSIGLITAGCSMLAGCGGSNLATVRGNVTFDGTPLETGSIVFEPADGIGPVAGGIIENGQYLLSDDSAAMPGTKIVRITAARPTGRKIEGGPPSPPGTLVDEVIYVPDRYGKDSTQSVQLEAGESTHDFELLSKPEGR